MKGEETPERTTVSQNEEFRRRFWPESSQRPGSPQSPLERFEMLGQVQQLMLELDRRLRCASDLFGDNVSALGMALARLEALEAGFSELLASEAQDQGEFSDDY